ncbi:hypothetical protein [Flavobacterium sp.]|uniref:hypothetical protein n=1 Tax=Flavobacterium sp. TaxID=239 RepID=UPI0037513C87
MLKKIKYLAIVTIVTSYVLQLCFVFSGTLIENFQQIRHQNQISKLLLSETKEISIETWNGFNDKKEIKINNIFYDVASFKITNKIVIVHVIADNFENQMRINLQSLFHKSKKSDSNQKKSFNTFNFIAVINIIETQKIMARIEVFTPNVYFTLTKNTKNTVLKLDKPPC